MRKKFAYIAGSLLLIGLLVLEFALVSGSAKTRPRSMASAEPATQSLPTLRGPEAIGHLKQQGLYNSLAEEMTAVNPLIVAQGGLTASESAANDHFGEAVAISFSIALSSMAWLRDHTLLPKFGEEFSEQGHCLINVAT